MRDARAFFGIGAGNDWFGRHDDVVPATGIAVAFELGLHTTDSFAVSGAVGWLLLQGRARAIGFEGSERVEFGDGAMHDFALMVIVQ